LLQNNNHLFRSVAVQPHNVKASIEGLINMVTTGPYVESYSITVSADSIALYVWLEMTGVKGRFSDNGFLLNTPTCEVVFLSQEFSSAQELAERLSVRAYNKLV
jgi:hypothetical protein